MAVPAGSWLAPLLKAVRKDLRRSATSSQWHWGRNHSPSWGSVWMLARAHSPTSRVLRGSLRAAMAGQGSDMVLAHPSSLEGP